MKLMPDKKYDLAIVDPPYVENFQAAYKMQFDSLASVRRDIEYKNWDSLVPKGDFFVELFRISKHQIVFGGNYFIEFLRNTNCFIVWDKVNGKNNFADCELAWTSFDTSTRMFSYRWQGFLQGDMKNKEKRIHPTQKPVALYKWLLKKYAKPGYTIIDTHLGSGSSAIACRDLGFKLDAFEIDEEYCAGAAGRLGCEKFCKEENGLFD
jgi:site-specific DNA-methyltransferase (adenine-specific)